MCSARGFFLELAPRIDEKHVGHTLQWNNFCLLMPSNNIFLQYLIHWSMNYLQKFSWKQRYMEIIIFLQKSNHPIVWREQELSNVAFSLTPFHFPTLFGYIHKWCSIFFESILTPLCVLKWGCTRIFPGNQDGTLK